VDPSKLAPAPKLEVIAEDREAWVVAPPIADCRSTKDRWDKFIGDGDGVFRGVGHKKRVGTNCVWYDRTYKREIHTDDKLEYLRGLVEPEKFGHPVPVGSYWSLGGKQINSSVWVYSQRDAVNVRNIGLKLDRPRAEDPLLKKPPLKYPVTIPSPAVVPPDSPTPGHAIEQDVVNVRD
ncbi:hypothetical protein DXG01_014987, partial [Tephrocybe rancida]